VLNFDHERNGYDKEYQVNPTFSFTFSLPTIKDILSQSVYIKIVAVKACELEISA